MNQPQKPKTTNEESVNKQTNLLKQTIILKQTIMSKVKLTDVRKVTIEYCKDYGGIPAWLMTEYFNGNKGADIKVAKREYFLELHTICLHYIEKGYIIEVIEYKA